MEVGLFGKKLGMTQIFDDQGSIIPVTLVEVKPCQVSQIKTIDSDSYNAIQIAYFEENLNRLTKPTLGHLKKSGDKGFKSFAEFRVSKPQDYKLGQKITVDSLDVGQKVKVLKSEELQAGYHIVNWDGTNDLGSLMSSGMYFYSIQAAEFQATKKMLFLK